MAIPISKSIQEIYPSGSLAKEKERWERVLSHFQSTYQTPAGFIVRCPGRVNVIGEHIDYSLYEVLPMAITADVLLVVAVDVNPSNDQPSRITLTSTHPDRFPTRTFELDTETGRVNIDSKIHEWSNYFKAGLMGALDSLSPNDTPRSLSRHLRVLVDGSVPSGGGLSSSSALVCGSLITCLYANRLVTTIKPPQPSLLDDKLKLAERAARCENLVGTASGGMDQAASVCSERGSALYVSFTPELSVKPVSFPGKNIALADIDRDGSWDFVFLVVNSLVTSNKQATAPRCYNLRVVECSLAAYAMAHLGSRDAKLSEPARAALAALKDGDDGSALGICLRSVQTAWHTAGDGSAVVSPANQLQTMWREARRLLAQNEDIHTKYTRDELCSMLDMSRDQLHAKFFTKYPIEAETFKLASRATHVFTEAHCVLRFLQLLNTMHSILRLEPPAGDDDTLQSRLNFHFQGDVESPDLPHLHKHPKWLGGVLNSSHSRCSNVFECSCSELDTLCFVARKAGALGSRMTGAGWGGGSVHLVLRKDIAKVRAALEEEYFRSRWPRITQTELDEAIVVVEEPGSGASVYPVTADRVV